MEGEFDVIQLLHLMAMNFFPYKIDNIKDKIVTMQPFTTVSHQGVHCSLSEEKIS